jgi:beta-glucanase (GH16 family)
MRSRYILPFAIVALSGCLSNTVEAQPAGWDLVWADEFGGSELDRNKWKPEQSCWGGGNQERQCYTDRPENVRVVDGFLHLNRARSST